MSHRIIIIKGSQEAPGGSLAEDTPSFEIVYPVPHEMTDAEVGQKVARIYKKANKLFGDDSEE